MNTHRDRHVQKGKALRKQVPRSSHGAWTPAADRPDPISYIGANDIFAKAIGQFTMSYADQTERDYDALIKAIKSGRVSAEQA